MIIYILIAVVLIVLLGGYYVYWQQQLNEMKSNCEQTFKQIETLMKARYQVVDELAIAVRGFTRKEMRILEKIKRTLDLAAVDWTTPQNQSHTENNMIRGINMLQEVCPQYPDLMASPHFRNVEQQLMALEVKFKQFTNAYNNFVKQYNSKIEAMPGPIFASISGTKPLPYFILDAVNVVGTKVQHPDPQ